VHIDQHNSIYRATPYRFKPSIIVKEVVSKVMEFFPSVKTQFASLQGIVSGEQYYKYDHNTLLDTFLSL